MPRKPSITERAQVASLAFGLIVILAAIFFAACYVLARFLDWYIQ